MRYEKPVVMQLGSRARRTKGQGPMACISGGSASGSAESCGTGTGAGWACSVGSGVSSSSYPLCASGSDAGIGDCFAGTGVSYYCGTGSQGSADPYGCRSGPAP